MRTCLISPPTITEFTESQVTDSEAIRLIAEHAPMGILSLAAVLENIGIVPTIVDLNQLYYDYAGAEKNHPGQISFCEFVVGSLESQQFDVFGFSTVCSSYPLTLRLAAEVKRTHPEATIILGGPQASVVDVQTLKAFPVIDLIVRGEAEGTLPRVLEALSGIVSYDVVPGITFRRGDGIVRNPNAPVIANLDNLPLAAFHLYPYIERCRYLPLEIGRGCPFTCSFCSTNDFFRRQFRLKSPDKVVQEMKLLKSIYGIRTFDLIHDMFTVNRRRVVEFCETVARSGERFLWGCSARTDCIDDELIDLMAETGCRGIFFGIDSGSEQMQRMINKRLDLSAAASRIERTDKRGIKTTVSLITGFPEETKDDLRATIRFLGDSLRLDNAEPQLHLLAPLAETPITTQYKDSLIFDDIFSDISHQGWQQEVPDREMIRSYPDIFTNFYAVPTRWLDRSHLKELREFILKGLRKFRWLFVALHQDCGDLLQVFDEWRSWYPQVLGDLFPDGDLRSYYLDDRFRNDFLNFVRSHYLPNIASHPLVVSAILDYQTALGSFDEAFDSREPECSTKVMRQGAHWKTSVRPAHAPNIRVVRSNMDLEDLLSCLREKRKLDQVAAGPVTLVFRPAKQGVEVVQLNEDTDRLFDLCDGVHTIDEIAKSFSLTEQDSSEIPAHKMCLFGLALLQERGLIEVPRASAVSSG